MAAAQLNSVDGFTWPQALADVPAWLNQAPNPWLLLTSFVSALTGMLGVWGFIADRMAPKPYTASQGAADRHHQNASFKAADDQQKKRHDADMGAHALTQSQLAALLEQVQLLTAQNAARDAETAIPFGETLTSLAQSPNPADVAIAQQAVDDSPEAAADALMAEGAAGKRRNAERFRQAARLYAPSSPAKAKAAYQQAVDLDPNDVWAWIELGRLKVHYDSLAAARACFGAALQLVSSDRDRMVLHNEFGNVLMAEGSLPDARAEYRAGFIIAGRLAAADPGNAAWQRDLSVSHERLGDVEVAAGDLAAARTAYAAGLDIAQRLAAADPGNAEWQRDLSVSHNKLGDVARAAGDLAAARTAYAAGLDIAQRLAATDPGNAEWQRDLSVSHNKLGDVEVAAGDLAAARTAYAAGLDIRQRLAATDPGNAEWQRDLSVSHERLGDVAEAMGDRTEAAACYRRSLPIAAALSQRWPDHPGFAKDLAITRRRLSQLERGG